MCIGLGALETRALELHGRNALMCVHGGTTVPDCLLMKPPVGGSLPRDFRFPFRGVAFVVRTPAPWPWVILPVLLMAFVSDWRHSRCGPCRRFWRGYGTNRQRGGYDGCGMARIGGVDGCFCRRIRRPVLMLLDSLRHRFMINLRSKLESLLIDLTRQRCGKCMVRGHTAIDNSASILRFSCGFFL